MLPMPELDGAPEDARRTIEARLRYEDIAQDGRLKLDALPPLMGACCWRGLLVGHPLTERLAADGVIAILRRFVLVGGDTPLSVHHAVRAAGRFGLAHVPGERRRFLLELRTDVEGPRGRTHGPPPERAGELGPAGRLYGEHVFTRPFAPPERRRVEALPADVGVGPERAWRQVEDVLDAPGEALDDALAHPAAVRLGLAHTDSNQHVNSLVYPRLAEERALAAWAEGDLLARALEIVYRKPSFAGDVLRVTARRLRREGRPGATVAFHAEGETRPRVAVQLWF
ncbi:MAG TPA: hypothetical protein RMH85_35060 [Polyangiaceae bacterium LLY-WYZ-15_(1-7)]|nr:hypothetical protein [Sandaracinus sp.]MBJ71650.1 hypothetical protein [Sandaracinus sp.]HJL04739.1 hypothetical protein [Polyangiaceae bacterium LLY-WYZ-15_(1-7)]HJL13759.1 hypothetical protein [Polyangiaceae bacterium LLY-WYZ-15_(1-7)]HJL39233.1 hypothetical protein [Polyangiaceae bacterium LLY-WYZ-15_(1-7)]